VLLFLLTIGYMVKNGKVIFPLSNPDTQMTVPPLPSVIQVTLAKVFMVMTSGIWTISSINCNNQLHCLNLDVSENSGTPKWMVHNGKPY